MQTKNTGTELDPPVGKPARRSSAPCCEERPLLMTPPGAEKVTGGDGRNSVSRSIIMKKKITKSACKRSCNVMILVKPLFAFA